MIRTIKKDISKLNSEGNWKAVQKAHEYLEWAKLLEDSKLRYSKNPYPHKLEYNNLHFTFAYNIAMGFADVEIKNENVQFPKPESSLKFSKDTTERSLEFFLDYIQKGYPQNLIPPVNTTAAISSSSTLLGVLQLYKQTNDRVVNHQKNPTKSNNKIKGNRSLSDMEIYYKEAMRNVLLIMNETENKVRNLSDNELYNAYKAAKNNFKKALSHEPKNYELLFSYGSYLGMCGEYKESIKVLHEVCENQKSNASALYLLGSAYIQTGNKIIGEGMIDMAIKKGYKG